MAITIIITLMIITVFIPPVSWNPKANCKRSWRVPLVPSRTAPPWSMINHLDPLMIHMRERRRREMENSIARPRSSGLQRPFRPTTRRSCLLLRRKTPSQQIDGANIPTRSRVRMLAPRVPPGISLRQGGRIRCLVEGTLHWVETTGIVIQLLPLPRKRMSTSLRRRLLLTVEGEKSVHVL